MRAEDRRSKATWPAVEHPAAARSTRRSRRTRAPHLRLVPSEPLPPAPSERGTAARLLLGFAAIAGFVGVGLWVEFGALERAAYLVSSLGFFSLYGAATWVCGAGWPSRGTVRALPSPETRASFRSQT